MQLLCYIPYYMAGLKRILIRLRAKFTCASNEEGVMRLENVSGAV